MRFPSVAMGPPSGPSVGPAGAAGLLGRGGEPPMPEAPARDPVPRVDPVLVGGHGAAAEQEDRAVEVKATPVGGIDLVGPQHPPIPERELHDGRRSRIGAGHGLVGGPCGHPDRAPPPVDRRGRQNAPAVRAGRHHGSAPDHPPVAQRVGAQPAPGGGKLAPASRAREHEAADDEGGSPEVVVGGLRAERGRAPDGLPGPRAQASQPVRGHHQAPPGDGRAPEEAQIPVAVGDGREAAPPCDPARLQVRAEDIAAQGRRDDAVADERRGPGHAPGHAESPALVQSSGRPRRRAGSPPDPEPSWSSPRRAPPRPARRAEAASRPARARPRRLSPAARGGRGRPHMGPRSSCDAPSLPGRATSPGW